MIDHPWYSCVHNPAYQEKVQREKYLTYEQACEQGLFDRVYDDGKQPE